ncbi:MAG: imidazole glycerol phosphate synthase cyclase subunit [Pseudomonadota bacterium]
MRVIARLDVKNEWVIKGIQMEGLRKVGDPVEFAKQYYDAGVHEIIFMDAVASLYDRNTLFHIIEAACENVFIPIIIGGGLRSLEDVSSALLAGADKVAINTAAVNNLSLVSQVAGRFGSQCIVGSIEAKRQSDGSWQAYVDNGREPTGLNVLDWVRELEAAGVGEILLTSVDQDGTKRGFDVELFAAVNAITTRPLILSGGYGAPEHLRALSACSQLPNAIAVGSVLHYNRATPADLIALAEGLEGVALAA